MRITELFTAQSIALDEAAADQAQIIDRLVELQATHGNITDREAYKKALYAREAEASTYVDNGITVPHARTACVTRPSLAAMRLAAPVQYNAEDDGKCVTSSVSFVFSKVLDESSSKIFSFYFPFRSISICVTRIKDTCVYAVKLCWNFEIEEWDLLSRSVKDISVKDCIDDTTSIFDGDTFSCSVPSCVNQVSFCSALFHFLNKFFCIFCWMKL